MRPEFGAAEVGLEALDGPGPFSRRRRPADPRGRGGAGLEVPGPRPQLDRAWRRASAAPAAVRRPPRDRSRAAGRRSAGRRARRSASRRRPGRGRRRPPAGAGRCSARPRPSRLDRMPGQRRHGARPWATNAAAASRARRTRLARVVVAERRLGDSAAPRRGWCTTARCSARRPRPPARPAPRRQPCGEQHLAVVGEQHAWWTPHRVVGDGRSNSRARPGCRRAVRRRRGGRGRLGREQRGPDAAVHDLARSRSSWARAESPRMRGRAPGFVQAGAPHRVAVALQPGRRAKKARASSVRPTRPRISHAGSPRAASKPVRRGAASRVAQGSGAAAGVGSTPRAERPARRGRRPRRAGPRGGPAPACAPRRRSGPSP